MKTVAALPRSAIYCGQIRHRRFGNPDHTFTYPIAMLYVDLNEWNDVFAKVPLWSSQHPQLVWLRADDYLPDTPGETLRERVDNTVLQATGCKPRGPVCLLTQPRYAGFAMNPISCFYCYAADGMTLDYMIAEVTNTPWRERIAYVLPCRADTRQQNVTFAKQMHVSPFNPMDMHYVARFNTAQKKLYLHLENHDRNGRCTDATLTLTRKAISRSHLLGLLWQYPLMTVQTAIGIYWQALQLWLRGARFHPHPATPTALSGETRR